MSLSLTCDCGARFDVEDTLAGQTVACPECQAPLKAPVGQRPPLRTSTLALASVVCALVGAFTLVGTVAAVVLGVVALVGIMRQRDRLAGLGFAAFGIVAGVLFTGLTLLAFSKSESFGMNNWARAQALAPYVDNTGPPEIVRPAYAITRPSDAWGVLTATPKDPVLRSIDNKGDLILVDTVHYGFIDVKVDVLPRNQTPTDYQLKMVTELCPHRNAWEPPDDSPGASVITSARVIGSDDLVAPTKPGFTEHEAVLEVDSGRQAWTMQVHLYRKNTRLYVVRCYASKRHFELIEPDFRKALDSFMPK